MKISAIADIHVKDSNSINYQFLLSFLKHEKVQESDTIYLLGDIFDLMIGNHHEYFSEFSQFFALLEDLNKREVKVHYVEGNHDFHLKRLFDKFINQRQLNPDYLQVHPNGLLEKVSGKDVLFIHGDEFGFDNTIISSYRKIIRSKTMQLVANYFINYKMLNYIGKRFSTYSRSKGLKKHSNNTIDRQLKIFHQKMEAIHRLVGSDYIICGHHHIQDIYQSKNGFISINVGEPAKTNSFLHFSGEGEYQFVPILSERLID